MADDTEALKHNLFFRSFFRHRGYYNLVQISPGKYRQDKLFTSPENSRGWLSATDLFTHEPNGVETLSPEGKRLLNANVAQYGDSFVSNPVVVEGYWTGDSPSDQLPYSRSRAILVRQYLQSHFQIDPGNIGAVGLNNLPPSGVGHSTWDGVCIVILKHHA
jgi:phospholipid/cholesterol/gamma-HCH transport system substrate-binding protein